MELWEWHGYLKAIDFKVMREVRIVSICYTFILLYSSRIYEQ